MQFLNTLRRRGLALLLAVLMCMSMLPVSALAANDEVKIKGTLELTGTRGYNHSWESTNENIAKVAAIQQYGYNTRTARVTGISEGWVDIIHSWGYDTWISDIHTETFTIHVISDKSPIIPEPDEKDSSLTAHLWVTNKKVHTSTDNPKEEIELTADYIDDKGTSVNDLAPDGYTEEISGKNCHYIFWKAVVHNQQNRQTDSGSDESMSGTVISDIQYNDETGKFQYSENGSSWTDFSDNNTLDFYYRGKTDLTNSATISVVDWWDNFSPTKIIYQTIDYLTLENLGDSYTTQYNDEFSQTTIWTTADEAGYFEVVAVTKNDQLTEADKKNLSDCNKNIYKPSGITFDVTPNGTTYIYL